MWYIMWDFTENLRGLWKIDPVSKGHLCGPHRRAVLSLKREEMG